MGIDKASVGRRNVGEKMVEELRKRLGDSLKVKTSNCEELRLTYFPARGRAEISRLILAHAGVKFDDIRLCQGKAPSAIWLYANLGVQGGGDLRVDGHRQVLGGAVQRGGHHHPREGEGRGGRTRHQRGL